VGDVLPLLLGKCHAQTECNIGVNDQSLGNPCERVDEENGARGALKYLSLVFMCGESSFSPLTPFWHEGILVSEQVFNEAAIKGRLETMAELEKEVERIRRLQKPTRISSLRASIEYIPQQAIRKSATSSGRSRIDSSQPMDSLSGMGVQRENKAIGDGELDSADEFSRPNSIENIDDLVIFVSGRRVPGKCCVL